MKKFKKMLSLALSAIMIAALIPAQAFAAETTKAVKEDIDWENWTMTNEPWATLITRWDVKIECEYVSWLIPLGENEETLYINNILLK